MKHFKTSIAAMILAVLSISFAWADVGIATGNPSLTYFKIGNDIKNVCKDSHVTVYESSGSLVNIERVLEDKRTQYAIVQQDALAFKALDDKKTKEKIKMIMPLYNEEIHFVVANPNIKSLKDLVGKRVVIGTEGSGNWVSSQIIKAKTEIEWVDVLVSPTEGINKMLLGGADAMFVVGGKPVSLLQNIGAEAKGKLRLVSMSHPALDDFYIKSSITEGMYAWSPGRINTYAVKSILVTFDFKSQYQNDISKLVGCITNNLGKLQSDGHAKWREVEPSDYKLVKWPVHPAAERFLSKVK
jgi:TRAP transporter TAXI family solute receptor